MSKLALQANGKLYNLTNIVEIDFDEDNIKFTTVNKDKVECNITRIKMVDMAKTIASMINLVRGD